MYKKIDFKNDGVHMRACELWSLLRMSKFGLQRLIERDHTFPRSAHLGPRQTLWKRSEVEAWLEAKFNEDSAAA